MRLRRGKRSPEAEGPAQSPVRDLYRLFGNGWGLLAVLALSLGAGIAAGESWSDLSVTAALKLALTPLAVVISMAIAAFALIAQLFKDEAPSDALANRIGLSPLVGSALFLFIFGIAAIGLILVHVAVAATPDRDLLGSVTVAFVVLVLMSAAAHVYHLIGFLGDFLRGRNDTQPADDVE